MSALLVAFAAITLATPALGGPNPDSWQAGVAQAVITPGEPMWMSGYGGRTKPAEGKLHDLWAKALALQAPDGERCVLVTMDLVGIDRDLAKTVCTTLEK